MRQSVAVTWGIVAMIFVGATAVGGSSIRRYSALEQRLLVAERQAAEHATEAARLAQRIQTMRAHLSDARTELTLTKRSLKTTQSLLDDATSEIRASNDAAEQQLSQIATLKTCLTAAAQALQYLSARDSYAALWVMTTADRACRDARALIGGR